MPKKSAEPKVSKTTTAKSDEYDVVILGCGTGGKLVAWTLAGKGMKVAEVERKYIGGSCVNVGCLPSKNVIHSAKAASFFFRSEEFGITKDNVQIHMETVRERKRKMVAWSIEDEMAAFKATGAELIMGSGRFTAPKTIEVNLNDGGKRVVSGKKVVINIGTRATVEPIPGLLESKPLTHIETLELDRIPGHLLIVGGGYIGLEFAQAMRRFGSRVTVIERNDRLAHREDEDVSKALHELFKDEGIDVITGAQIERVEGTSGDAVKLHVRRGKKTTVLEGTHILIAAGRTPNTNGIGLDLAGVQLTERGYIKTNERLETTAPDVWAIGECAGSPQFTHISENDFHIATENILGGKRVTTGRQVPYCMFTDPELARIGLNETEAKEKKIPYRLAKLPMDHVFRARTISETRGFMKAIIGENDRILGFTAFGSDAGEVMATVQIAMLAGLPYTALRDAIFTHPTMSEGLIQLFMNVQK